jgi:hypothetical protein
MYCSAEAGYFSIRDAYWRIRLGYAPLRGKENSPTGEKYFPFGGAKKINRTGRFPV